MAASLSLINGRLSQADRIKIPNTAKKSKTKLIVEYENIGWHRYRVEKAASNNAERAGK